MPVSPGKVLLLNPSDEGYGVDRMCALTAQILVERGHQVVVGLPTDSGPGWLSAELDRLGIQRRTLHLAVARRRYLSPFALPRYAAHFRRSQAALRSLVVDDGFDVVYVNSLALLPALCARNTGALRVLHCHEIVEDPAPMKLLLRTSRHLVDAVLCVSEAVAAPIGSDREAIEVCTNGIPELPPELLAEVEHKLGRDPDDPVQVSFIGRLSSFKATDTFLEVVERLKDADAVFHVAGGPIPGEDTFLQLVLDAQDRGLLTYHGELADTSALHVASDVLVAPSRTPDPYPTVVLEALRAGTAVVATNGGGARESVLDGRTGRLVDMNDVDGLTETVRELIADRQALRPMQRAARKDYLERHTLSGFHARLEEAYDRIGF